MQEIWKDIEGYEGFYQLSNIGRIKSLYRETIGKNGGVYVSSESIMRTGVSQSGYKRVGLRKDGVTITKKIHVLLAKHFIPNPNNYPVVRHLNDNKLDNRLENLAWGTYKDNMQDAIKNGKTLKGEKHFNFGKKGEGVSSFGKKHKNKRKTEQTTAKLILDTQTGIFYLGIKEAAFAKCIGYSTLAMKLSGYHYNNTSLIYA